MNARDTGATNEKRSAVGFGPDDAPAPQPLLGNLRGNDMIAPRVSPVDIAPTPSPEQRIAVVRSLLGHRKPSELLCQLVILACEGRTWDEIADVDKMWRAAR